MTRHPLKGSERALPAQAVDVGEADPHERLEVSVLVRRREQAEFDRRVGQLEAGDRSEGVLSRQAFAERFGADQADMDQVASFAAEHGLSVVGRHAARRTVVLSGTVEQVNAAFAVSLRRIRHLDGNWRGRVGAIGLPADLHGVVEAVLGMDNRPQARAHFRISAKSGAAAGTSYTPAQVAAAYGFPPGEGTGECVGLIELGGGYTPADLATYFSAKGVSPAPKVIAVSVDQATNAPTGTADGPDGEVMLDIEIVGSVAPGAQIAVYFAPNTDQGFIDAVTTAVHDETHKPSVISISWGGPESSWTAQSLTALDSAFQAAATLGVTVCVACGDNGSSDGATDGADHVDFPASSPHALACGGTSLTVSGRAISGEAVWNDGSGGGATGGGVSAIFALPSFQTGLNATSAAGVATPLAKRGTPDVAGDADPATGYQVRVDGADSVFGGTSAVAPLWAGLIALINASKGSPVGYVHPALYGQASAFNDITSGNNGDFKAAPGWDACTGLGSPRGAAIAKLLGG